MSAFNNWLDTFIQEKGIDLEQRFDVEGPVWGTNSFDYGVIVEHIKIAGKDEQNEIRDTIVKIDFANGDVKHYFRHLAQALAR
jgi:hypothetical protein